MPTTTATPAATSASTSTSTSNLTAAPEAGATPPAAPPDLGPRGLADSGPFVLSTAEWLGIQTYVASGLHLPNGKDAFAKSLPAPPPGGVDAYADLIAAYAGVYAHCETFNDTTLPDSVQCAADIVHYNQKVPTYYGALTKLLPALTGPNPDPAAQQQFAAIVGNLAAQAKVNGDHAGMVGQAIKAFADQSTQDAATLNPLLTSYRVKLGATSPQIATLTQEADADAAAIKEWNAKYEHDTIVAATSATYGWIWPFGTIAAAVVAGIYGKRATDDVKHVHEFQAKLDLVDNQLKAAATLLLDLGYINDQLGDVSGKLAAALPTIQKIEGIWGALADDLTALQALVQNDIANAPAIIAGLGIDEAISAWAAVAKEADAYRVNAYITVGTEAEAAAAGAAQATAINAVQTTNGSLS